MQSYTSSKALSALLATFIASVPQPVKAGFLAFVLLLVVDFITGVRLAVKKGEISSNRMRGQTWRKLKQYAGILGLFASVAVLFWSSWWLLPGFAMCYLMEWFSIMENIVWYEAHGGRPLPPFARRWFAAVERMIVNAMAPPGVQPPAPLPPDVDTERAVVSAGKDRGSHE